MPGGKGNIKGTDNVAGFQKNPQNINKKGRPPSIRNALRELLESDGVLRVEAKNIIETHEDGSVSVKIPTEQMMALKLNHWALSKKGPDSLKALEMIMSHLEGRAPQSLSVSMGQNNIQYNLTDEQVQEVLKELKPKDD